MRAHRHAYTLPNPEALGPVIEEGAVNRRPLQALFLLLRGGASPATALAPFSYRLLLRWKGGQLTLISKNSRRRNWSPDRALGSDKAKVNGDLCPPLSFLPGGVYSQSYRWEWPLTGEI